MAIQFSRIELHPRHTEPNPIVFPTERINGQKVCRVCGINEVWGYAGNGVYVPDTCRRCYRAAGIESRERARSPKFYHHEGRS